MKTFITFLLIIAAAIGLTSCIEDGFSTSPSDQPAFSTDTLRIADKPVHGLQPPCEVAVD